MIKNLTRKESGRSGGGMGAGLGTFPRKKQEVGSVRINSRSGPRADRCGAFTLVEMMVASVLLTAVFIAVAPMVSWVSAQNRLANQRQFALLEVGNAMEAISGIRPELITQESLARIELSDEAAGYLKQARFNVTAAHAPGPPAAQRVTIELTWKNRANQYVAPVRLTALFVQPSAEGTQR